MQVIIFFLVIYLLFIIYLGNKIKDMLKSNEGDFMFPKTEANLFMVMNNIKNCKIFFYLFLFFIFNLNFLAELSFPEDIFLRRSGKIKSQYDYEEEILNKFT